MEKYKKLTSLSYILVFIGILLFFAYTSTANLMVGICAVIASYASIFLYYYVHYKITGQVRWVSLIITIVAGVIILLSIL